MKIPFSRDKLIQLNWNHKSPQSHLPDILFRIKSEKMSIRTSPIPQSFARIHTNDVQYHIFIYFWVSRNSVPIASKNEEYYIIYEHSIPDRRRARWLWKYKRDSFFWFVIAQSLFFVREHWLNGIFFSFIHFSTFWFIANRVGRGSVYLSIKFHSLSVRSEHAGAKWQISLLINDKEDLHTYTYIPYTRLPTRYYCIYTCTFFQMGRVSHYITAFFSLANLFCSFYACNSEDNINKKSNWKQITYCHRLRRRAQVEKEI